MTPLIFGAGWGERKYNPPTPRADRENKVRLSRIIST